MSEHRWDYLSNQSRRQHAVRNTHTGITYCGRDTDLFGSQAPRLAPKPHNACRRCVKAIVKEGQGG